jgi:hypothetical protein
VTIKERGRLVAIIDDQLPLISTISDSSSGRVGGSASKVLVPFLFGGNKLAIVQHRSLSVPAVENATL